MEWYFVIWYLAATGARVSELIQIKIEHIEIGYFDLYTKGGKLRRLYIPKKLKKETLEWLEETHRFSGYLFLNRYGERITTRGISQQLKNYAEKYGLDKKVVYPHSFRHRYAKNFLEKYNDIALLADLMGHESIETTRIYLRRTASEQQELVDKIVNLVKIKPSSDEGGLDVILYFGLWNQAKNNIDKSFRLFYFVHL